MLFMKDDNDFADTWQGHTMSIASALFQCCVYICIKLAYDTPASILILTQGICSCCLSGLALFVWFRSFHFFAGGIWQEYVCVAGVCLVGYLAQYSLTRGCQILISGLASLLRTTDIGWAFVWGVLFFHQTPNYITIIGAILMFLSVVIITIDKMIQLYKKGKTNLTDLANTVYERAINTSSNNSKPSTTSKYSVN